MRIGQLVNIAKRTPDAKLWHKMHEVERTAKEVYDSVMELVRYGMPSEAIDEECDNYKVIEAKTNEGNSGRL